MKFSNLVSESLANNGKISLSLLVEETESEETGSSDKETEPSDKETKKSDDPFAILDDESSSEDESSSDESGDGGLDLGSEGSDLDDDTPESPKEDRNNAVAAINDLAAHNKKQKSIEDKRDQLIDKYQVRESYYKKLNLNSFIMLEEKEDSEVSRIEDTLEDYEKEIEALEDRYFNVADAAEKGESGQISVTAMVDEALDDIKNFYSKRKPSFIIYNEKVAQIGKKGDIKEIESLIKQFRDELNAKLDPEDRIGIQEKPTKYNAAVGASSAGKS